MSLSSQQNYKSLYAMDLSENFHNSMGERKSREANLTNSDKVKEIEECFNLMSSGEKNITLINRKDIVLVMGITGGGKTTFALWLTGDDSKLRAKKVSRGTYIIEDEGGKIGRNPFESKTITPEIFFGPNNQTVFYDCPGFGETRGFSRDISQSFFIKKLTDHAEKIKIVLVANHSDLKKAVTRTMFTDLLKYVTNLIKNVEKYKDSFAIVATKVINKKEEGVLISDDVIIEEVGKFIVSSKHFLESKNLNASSSEWKSNSEQIKLIDALITRNQKGYSKIGVFRRPDAPGLLSENELIKKAKKNIETIVYETLKYTTKSNGDFGFSISEISKGAVNDLIEYINKNIYSNATRIVEEIKKDLSKFGDTAGIKSQFEIGNEKVAVQEIIAKVKSLNDVEKQLQFDVKKINNIESFVNLIAQITGKVTLRTSQELLSNLKSQTNYFNFLQSVSVKKLNNRHAELTAMLHGLTETISPLKLGVISEQSIMKEKIRTQLKSEIPRETNFFKQKIHDSDFENIPNQFSQSVEITESFVHDIEILKDFQNLFESVAKYVEKLNSVGLKDRFYKKVVVKMECLNLLFTETGENEFMEIKNIFLVEMRDISSNFDISRKWFTFLLDLYNKLSEYEFQEEKSKFNVSNVEDWGRSSRPQGINITENDFRQFLHELKPYELREHSFVENLKPSHEMLKDLNEVLMKTLKTGVEVYCFTNKLKMIIKGTFVKLSDLFAKSYDGCKDVHSMETIEVFAVKVIFIDRDISIDSLKLSLIAPKWEVIGSRMITLDGHIGPDIVPESARDGILTGSAGEDGLPGFPGGSSGSFFGIAQTCERNESLYISIKGGRGGDGQNGGRGQNGRIGEDAKIDNNGNCEPYGLRIIVNKTKRRTVGHSIVWEEIYTKNGTYGDGGDGGCFGSGGLGGLSGKIDLSFDDHKIEFFSGIGESGKDGSQGLKGNKGEDGRGMKLTCQFIIDERNNPSKTIRHRDSQFYDMVENSHSNRKVCYQKPPEKPKSIILIENKAQIFKDFESYFTHEIRYRFNRKTSNSFLTYFKTLKKFY